MRPIRSLRTLDLVTSTPQRSQITPLYLNFFIFTAVTFPVLARSEDALTEQAVFSGFNVL